MRTGASAAHPRRRCRRANQTEPVQRSLDGEIKLHPKREMSTYPLRIIGRRQETADAVSLWLDVSCDLSVVFHYQAGQFVTIEKDIAGQTVRRECSLISVRGWDPGLRITVQKVPDGRMSAWLVNTVKVGEVLEVARPRGRRYAPPGEFRHYLFVGAGSGVLQLIANNAGHLITMAYGDRSVEAMILREELDRLDDSPYAGIEHVLSRPNPAWGGAIGHVDPEYLSKRWGPGTGQARPYPQSCVVLRTSCQRAKGFYLRGESASTICAAKVTISSPTTRRTERAILITRLVL